MGRMMNVRKRVSLRLWLGIALCIGVALLLFNAVFWSHLSSSGPKKWDGSWDSRFRPLTEDDTNCLERGIILTREYQTKLHRKNISGPRSGNLVQHLQMIEAVMQLPGISDLSKGQETIRYQYTMDTIECGKGYNPRGRDYIAGYRAGTSTFDVKSSTTGQEEASTIMHKDWSPFPAYQKTNLHKFEWDIHPCKVKYSLESRIDIPFRHRFKRCGELMEIFPRMAEGIKEGRRDKKLSIQEMYSGWWYELEHHGVMPDGLTLYKTACTIQYASYEDAKEGLRPINIPEWSIRLWGSYKGTGPFVEKTLEEVNERYQQLLLAVKNADLPCAEEFQERLF